MNTRLDGNTTGGHRVSTVYVVDDDASIRELIAWLMQANGIAVMTFANAQTFIDTYLPGSPGCIVLDLHMPGMSGLDLQQYLIQHGITMPVLFLSGRADVPNAVAAVKQGAVDFIEKPFDYKKIVPLIVECLRRDLAQRAVQGRSEGSQERFSRLTQREREVMEQVVNGKTNRVIADSLGISIKTVEAHRARLMEKLEVESLAELMHVVLGKFPTV